MQAINIKRLQGQVTERWGWRHWVSDSVAEWWLAHTIEYWLVVGLQEVTHQRHLLKTYDLTIHQCDVWFMMTSSIASSYKITRKKHRCSILNVGPRKEASGACCKTAWSSEQGRFDSKSFKGRVSHVNKGKHIPYLKKLIQCIPSHTGLISWD